MHRYFMHICNGTGFVEDEEGVELYDRDAAYERAVASARDVMSADIRNGFLDLTSFIEVEDEERSHLFTLIFADVVKITANHSGQAEEPGKAASNEH
jgi:hypothetical protein